MKVGSLFSGIGGFDLAFERAGFEIAWLCEIDKNCQNVLRGHFPDVEIIDDVKEVGSGRPVDVIVGGFPCQDLSVAGKRAGLAGERSGLWFEFARVIDELEPKWVVIENVPGLLSSNKGRDFAIIIQWLAERGYGVAWRVLDAQYFRVPQRRRRVFIVASFGTGRASEVLFERESSPGDTAPSREKGQGTATSTLRGFGHGWQGQHNDTNSVIAWQMNHASEAYREGKDPNISPTLQERMGTGGNNVPLVGVRRLTPVECSRLQGFPDDWNDGQSDTVRYRQLGNAVAVPVVEWIARRIKEAEDGI